MIIVVICSGCEPFPTIVVYCEFSIIDGVDTRFYPLDRAALLSL